MTKNTTDSYDVLIIGGGINGTAVARDAAGRGLTVLLCEKDDLASHTSSASTKLVHGGLRYLEQFEFRLVRKSLQEREVLWRAAPHIISPLRFVLPHDKGLRPAWFLRLGLFVYDHIGGRKLLPPTKTIKLNAAPHAGILKPRLQKGFEYSDCWVEDSRLVTLNAVDAHERGAEILTRAEVCKVDVLQDGFTVEIVQDGTVQTVRAKTIVNAAGPWVEDVLFKAKHNNGSVGLRLVKGSHIVTRKLFSGDHGYIFQNSDGRIIFAIPYEKNYTLIGTTDNPYDTNEGPIQISEAEKNYLCEAASEYFCEPVTPADIVWTYSGVRPLFDDKSENASSVTRDYVLKLEEFAPDAPFLSIYGGKITTSRKLAENVLKKLTPYFTSRSAPWTRDASLPGGDIPNANFVAFYKDVSRLYPSIPPQILHHLARAYGTRIRQIMELSDTGLGRQFGSVLTEAEVSYLVKFEWAKSADDILWRRTKLGLHMSEDERRDFIMWFKDSANELSYAHAVNS